MSGANLKEAKKFHPGYSREISCEKARELYDFFYSPGFGDRLIKGQAVSLLSHLHECKNPICIGLWQKIKEIKD